MNTYCTSFNTDYLLMFLALHDSMERFCKPYTLYVLTLDDEADWFLRKAKLPNVKPVNLAAVMSPALTQFRADHNKQAFLWTLKSKWLLYLLETIASSHLCYLDCDSWWWAGPESVWEEIRDRELVITPHRFSEHIRHYVENGIFNAGFMFLQRTAANIKVVWDWHKTALKWDRGPVSDQIALNVWPERYGAYSLRHPGVNLSVWNQLGQYHYATENKRHMVDGYPIVWYHYHGGPTQGSYRLHYFISGNLYHPYRRAIQSARVQADEIIARKE